MEQFNSVDGDEKRHLNLYTTYKLREGLYMYFTENMVFVAENGMMVQYPFPEYYNSLMDEAETRQKQEDEYWRNVKQLEKTGIPEVVENTDDISTKTDDQLKDMMNKAVIEEDYEKCRTIDLEQKRRAQ